MAKQSKNRKGLKRFFFKTRLGFYVLVFAAIVGLTSTTNAFKDADYKAVLAAKDNSRGSNEEAQRQKEQIREDRKQEIQQKFKVETEGLEVKINPGVEKRAEKSIIHKTQDVNLVESAQDELEDDVIEDFEEINDVTIASDNGDLVLKKNKVKARTGFPLSIDVNTGQLTVTRPDGTVKNVAILPDKAVENFLRHKKVELVGLEPPDDGDGTGTDSAEPDLEDPPGTESADQEFGITSLVGNIEEETNDETVDETEGEVEVEIVEKDNELVYEIKGKRKIKILGLIPSQTSITGYVSTETGDVVGEDVSLIDRFLNLISIQE